MRWLTEPIWLFILRLFPRAGDPSNLENGMIWYDSLLNKFRKRENGATSDLAGGSSSSGSAGEAQVSDGAGGFETAASATLANITLPSGVVKIGDPAAAGGGAVVEVDNANSIVRLDATNPVLLTNQAGGVFLAYSPNTSTYWTIPIDDIIALCAHATDTGNPTFP